MEGLQIFLIRSNHILNRGDELPIEDGCVLWGMRVIVPKKLQSEVLNMLLEVQVGMVKKKMIA